MGILTYPLDIKNSPHIRIVTKTYSLPNADIPGEKNVDSKVINRSYFYIPTNLTQGVNTSWTPEEPSVVGQNYKSGGGFIEQAKLIGGQLLFKMSDKLAPGASENIKTNMGALKGLAMKPTNVLILSEVGRYSINLNFDLTPQSPEEGDMVKRIIRSFRSWSQPTLNTAGAKLWMDYPHIFDISIHPNYDAAASAESSSGKELFHYNNMVIETFSATHSGGSNESLFYSDGTPVQTALTLGFKSLRPGWNNIDSKAALED